MRFTKEQRAIINSSGNIKINAVAGSGKTTTMIAYAKARPSSSRILYLAFNKSVKLEALRKFQEASLNNVQVETAHSLAYKNIVFKYGYKVNGLGYKTHEIVDILKLERKGEKHDEYVVANHVNKFTAYFCNSNAKKVQDLNYLNTIKDQKAKVFVKNYYAYIEQQTRIFLAKLDRKEIDITHDFYLKKFQLSQPILNYDYILFDEGQDASPTMLDIFARQTSTKVIVGDTNQQIYSWRYAVNSLEKVDFKNFQLSQSFRFRQDIADMAIDVLNWKQHLSSFQAPKIQGYGNSSSKKLRATLARTNLGLLLKAIEFVTEKNVKHLYFEGNINSYTYAEQGGSLYDILNLHNGNHGYIRDAMIKHMRTIEDLEEYVENTDERDLGLMIQIVKEYGNDIPKILNEIKEKHVSNAEKDKAEMIFSTVHRCKGMEYDSVQIVNDFISEERIESMKNDPEVDLDMTQINEEINLLYVAITRTKNRLYIPSNLVSAKFAERAEIFLVKSENPKEKLKKKSEEKLSVSQAYLRAFSVIDSKKRQKSSYQKWTEEADEELTDMYCEGLSVREMAEHFGRTKGAIQSRIKKLDLHNIYGWD